MSTGYAVTPAGAKFRRLAEGMAEHIADKRRPMTQNPTHKRLREYHSRLFDADQLESVQKGLFALANAHDDGSLPQQLLAIKSKAEVFDLMRLESDRVSDYIRTNGKYSNTTPIGVALQELVAAALGPQDDAAKAALKVRRQIEDIENDLRFQKIPGFFPTPKSLADDMATIACIHPGHMVLEPSAGLGHLADAVKRAQPHCVVHCIEIMPRLAEVLRLKEHAYLGSDFMADDWYIKNPTVSTPAAATGRYDRILMNPPFERGQDAEHVRRAFSFLKPGGILVALVSTGPFYRSDNASQAFREFVRVNNAQTIDVGPGAFTGVEAFKQTGVSTKLVVIRGKKTYSRARKGTTMLQWHKWETVAEFKACRSKCGRYVIRRRYKAGGQRLTNSQRHMIAFQALTVAQGDGAISLVSADPSRPNEYNTENAAKAACERVETDRLAVLKELGKSKPRTILERMSFNV